MTSRDFAYWLKGHFELSDSDSLSSEQIAIIKNHLDMVFVHEIDPSMGNQEHQEKLNMIHNSIPQPDKPEPYPSKNPSQILRC
jgi:hypothetical protein